MEDQDGGLAAPEEARPPVARKTGRKRRLTVMIMGSVGKVRSFEISSRVVFFTILFFTAYVLLSLVAINLYLQLRQSSGRVAEKIRRIEEESSAYRKNLLRSKQHIALLEDYIRRIEKETDPASGAGKEATPPEEVSRTGKAKPSAAAGIVDVADMVVQREGARLNASFKLINTQPGEGAVGGYVHLMAVDRKSRSPKEWIYPAQKINQGEPVNYRNGQIFLISRFKQIHVRFNLGSPSESPTILKLLVYDQAGDILLQKEFEVSHAS